MAVTFMPRGVAERCLMFTSVPTVDQPGGSRGAAAAKAAFSIRAIMAGVAKTARPPEPRAEAVFPSVTVSAAWAVRPGLSISVKSMDAVI